jgi:hypothetical protein
MTLSVMEYAYDFSGYCRRIGRGRADNVADKHVYSDGGRHQEHTQHRRLPRCGSVAFTRIWHHWEYTWSAYSRPEVSCHSRRLCLRR